MALMFPQVLSSRKQQGMCVSRSGAILVLQDNIFWNLSHFGVAVIGIQRKKQSVDDRGEIKIEMELQQVPGPDEIISSDDVLVVVGDRFQIKQIARKD